jgi:hypothetical protein
LNGALEWVAAIATITWIVSSLMNNAMPLVASNAILLVINIWGVWQYLLNPKKKREIEKAEEIAEQARDVVAQEG